MVVNSQLSSWSNTEAGVPQRSFFSPLLIWIYINDLLDDLTTNARLADDVSLFFEVDKINFSATYLKSNLSKINAWANQQKMTFNLDTNKQAHEVIFSRKINEDISPSTKL